METNSNDPTFITDQELYIDDDNDNPENELELSNLSWVNSVEEELGKSLEDKVLTGSLIKDEEDKVVEQYKLEQDKLEQDIDKILRLKYKELKDSEIIAYMTNLSNYLRRELRGLEKIEEFINNEQFFDIINWLLHSSEFMSKKIGLPLLSHNALQMKNNSIPRSSYKFCNYNYECEFNYNAKKHKGCFAQHYVHNMVYADLESIIKYIKDNKKKEINHNKFLDEIRKSVNTVSFVINHMNEEMKNAYIYNKSKNIHIERTPNKKKTRKFNKKKDLKKKINL